MAQNDIRLYIEEKSANIFYHLVVYLLVTSRHFMTLMCITGDDIVSNKDRIFMLLSLM